MNPASTKQLITDLVAGYVEHPEAIEVGFQERRLDDGHEFIYWALGCHPDDEAPLIGQGGCHAQALTFLIERMGAASGKTYAFRLVTKGKPRNRPRAHPLDAVSYDPAPKQLLLFRLLLALGIEAKVSVGPGNGNRKNLLFVFSVDAHSEEDYRALTVPVEGEEKTVVGEVGCLYRAVAKRAGVRFTIQVNRAPS
jgi:predicted RNA-binding protein YlqC (UPF0109 family)